MKKINLILKLLALPVLCLLPFFIWTFFLQSPILISFARTVPLRALLMFVNIGDGATSDLYFALMLAILVVWLCYAISMWSQKAALGFRCVLYLVLVTTFIARKFLLVEFGLQLTPSTFSLLQETNGHEVSGFLDTYIMSKIGIKYLSVAIGLYLVVLMSDILYGRKLIVDKVSERLKTILGGVIASVVVMSVPAIRGGYEQLMQLPGGQSTFSAIQCTLLKLSKTSEESHSYWNKIQALAKEKGVASCSEDSINVVFVLGESFIKAHSSLYGYPLKTMPNMEKEKEKGNLFVFEDLVTPYNGTSNAMKNLFCLNDMSQGEKWYQSIYWPQLLKKAGYKLYLWDNQKNFDKHHGNTFYEMYSHQVVNVCYDRMNETAYDYDEDIVVDFKKNGYVNYGGKNYVWFHLMGQHFAFADKCPNDKKVFQIKDIKRTDGYLTNEMKQVIADYDNAVHYNDEVLKSIIDLFRNTNSVLVFISDHGEEAYDYRAKTSRPAMETGLESEYAHCQYDVPLFVWCSDQYLKKHKDVIKELKSSKGHSSMSDKIGYSMLRLAQVKTKYYVPQRDITNMNFQKTKRTIYLMGGEKSMDYDVVTHYSHL